MYCQRNEKITMKNILNKMIEQLSGEDKKSFSQLAERLKQVAGDISKLSKNERDLISDMEIKYADKLGGIDTSIEPEIEIDTNQSEVDDILTTGFAAHVRQILARDLKSQFPKEEDAVKFAFQNKWLPDDLKENDSALQLFEDYKQDICAANQWREDLVEVESDKCMAVGLTWFMVLFQLNEHLN